MTREEKQLLLIDICARLLYGVMCNVFNGKYDEDMKLSPSLLSWDINDIKPYLRSMSTMTEMEKQQFNLLSMNRIVPDGFGKDVQMYSIKCIDWLNAHHFDYRGLIEKGLALEAPRGMYNN